MHTTCQADPGVNVNTLFRSRDGNHKVNCEIPYRSSLSKIMLSLTVHLPFLFLPSFVFEVEIRVLILYVLMASKINLSGRESSRISCLMKHNIYLC